MVEDDIRQVVLEYIVAAPILAGHIIASGDDGTIAPANPERPGDCFGVAVRNMAVGEKLYFSVDGGWTDAKGDVAIVPKATLSDLRTHPALCRPLNLTSGGTCRVRIENGMMIAEGGDDADTPTIIKKEKVWAW